jgi:hypothetical protein
MAATERKKERASRSQREVLEVDCAFLLPPFDAVPGDRFDVKISGVRAYKLIAEPV